MATAPRFLAEIVIGSDIAYSCMEKWKAFYATLAEENYEL
jgi:hypothetical protein